MKSRRGFTLIELLISIGIIAVLIGILVPALTAARARGRRTACSSSLKQVGLGLRSYLDGNNDIFPYASDMPSVDPAPIGFPAPGPNPQPVDPTDLKPIFIADVLLMHVGNQTKTFACPSDVGDYERTPPNTRKSYFQTEKSSYQYRSRLGGLTASEWIKRRAEFTGTTYNENTGWIFCDYNNFHGPNGQPGARRYLFYDGHVSDFENF